MRCSENKAVSHAICKDTLQIHQQCRVKIKAFESDMRQRANTLTFEGLPAGLRESKSRSEWSGHLNLTTNRPRTIGTLRYEQLMTEISHKRLHAMRKFRLLKKQKISRFRHK